MTSNILKNFAAATVAGAFLSFAVAATAVSFAAVIHLTSGQHAGQTQVGSVQQ